MKPLRILTSNPDAVIIRAIKSGIATEIKRIDDNARVVYIVDNQIFATLSVEDTNESIIELTHDEFMSISKQNLSLTKVILSFIILISCIMFPTATSTIMVAIGGCWGFFKVFDIVIDGAFSKYFNRKLNKLCLKK